MCGFYNVWVCVCVGFVMCGCFGNTCTCIYCVFYCFFYVYLFFFLISSFMYVIVKFMYSYYYVCSVLYILFSSCQLALFGYPD